MPCSFELEWIRSLHQYRNALFDRFFTFLNFFDRPEFFFILIPILWIGHSRKMGLRLFYILFFSTFINQRLKEFFTCPRPFHLEPTLAIIQVDGYGLPSGAAQTAILLAGLLLNFWKSPWKWVVAPLYVLFISFSRIYLGIHFPSDILVGWIIGTLLLMLFTYVRPFIENQLEKFSIQTIFFISQSIPLLLIWQCPILISICSIAMGIGIGLLISYFYHLPLPAPKQLKEWILCTGLSVSSISLLYAITKILPHSPFYLFLQFTILGIWLSIGSSWLCHLFLPHLSKEKG